MLVEKGAGGPHVARTGHRELELDALLLALASQLVHLSAQGLRRLRNRSLEHSDLGVTLGEKGPVVRARPCRVGATGRQRLLRCLLPRLTRRRAPRTFLFLRANLVTGHADLPFCDIPTE